MTGAAFEDGIALLGELACVVVLGGNGLLYLPVVAQGGDRFGFGLAAKGTDISKRTGEGAGGDDGVTFLPVVGAVCGRLAGAVHQIINRVIVGDGITGGGCIFHDGNIFVAVGDSRRVAALQSDLIGAVGVVIAPIDNRDRGAGGGVIIGVVRFVDDGRIILDLGDFIVVAYDAIIAACDTGGAGGGGVGVVDAAGDGGIGDDFIDGKYHSPEKYDASLRSWVTWK